MEKPEKQSRKSKIRKVELAIWLTVILVTILLGVFLFIKHEKSFETHKIIMPDVDGLIVGSPVNIMGIPIGYVTKHTEGNKPYILSYNFEILELKM